MQEFRIANVEFLMQDNSVEAYSEHVENYGTVTLYRVPVAISIGGDYWLSAYTGSTQEYQDGDEPKLKDAVFCLVDELASALFDPDEFYETVTQGKPDRGALRNSLDFLDFVEAHDFEVERMIEEISGVPGWLNRGKLEEYLKDL